MRGIGVAVVVWSLGAATAAAQAPAAPDRPPPAAATEVAAAEAAAAALVGVPAGDGRGLWVLTTRLQDIHPRAGLPALLAVLDRLPANAVSEVQLVILGWTGTAGDRLLTGTCEAAGLAARWREWWAARPPAYRFPCERVAERLAELDAEIARLLAAEADPTRQAALAAFQARLAQAVGVRGRRFEPVPAHPAAAAMLVRAALAQPGGMAGHDYDQALHAMAGAGVPHLRPSMVRSKWLLGQAWYDWWVANGASLDLGPDADQLWRDAQAAATAALAAEPDAAVRARLQALATALIAGQRPRDPVQPSALATLASDAAPAILILWIAAPTTSWPDRREAHEALRRLSGADIALTPSGGLAAQARAVRAWLRWWGAGRRTASIPAAALPHEAIARLLVTDDRVPDPSSLLHARRWPVLGSPSLPSADADLDRLDPAVARVIAAGAPAIREMLEACRAADQVLWRAAEALAIARARGLTPAIGDVLGDPAPGDGCRVVVGVAWFLAGDADGVPILLGCLGSPRPDVRRAAAWVLGGTDDARAADPLRRAVEDPDTVVTRIAVAALVRRGDQGAAPILDRVCGSHPMGDVREAALEALQALGSPLAAPHLLAALEPLGATFPAHAEALCADLDRVTGLRVAPAAGAAPEARAAAIRAAAGQYRAWLDARTPARKDGHAPR